MTNTRHHTKTTNESQLILEIAFNQWRPLWHCLKYGFRKQQGHLCFQKQVQHYVVSFTFPLRTRIYYIQ